MLTMFEKLPILFLDLLATFVRKVLLKESEVGSKSDDELILWVCIHHIADFLLGESTFYCSDVLLNSN